MNPFDANEEDDAAGHDEGCDGDSCDLVECDSWCHV